MNIGLICTQKLYSKIGKKWSAIVSYFWISMVVSIHHNNSFKRVLPIDDVVVVMLPVEECVDVSWPEMPTGWMTLPCTWLVLFSGRWCMLICKLLEEKKYLIRNKNIGNNLLIIKRWFKSHLSSYCPVCQLGVVAVTPFEIGLEIKKCSE